MLSDEVALPFAVDPSQMDRALAFELLPLMDPITCDTVSG